MDPNLLDSQNAVLQKYLVKEGEETWWDVCHRVCTHIASAEKEDKRAEWYTKFMSIMVPMKFVPSGSILANSDHGTGGLCNCYVTHSDDSMESITEMLHDSIMTTRFRGGIGINVGSEGQHGYIREKGAPYKDGSALGPCSVLDMVSSCNAKLTTGNRARRGAFLFSMDWRHPDIWEFIQAKTESKIDANFTRRIVSELSELVKSEETQSEKEKKLNRLANEFKEAWTETHLSTKGKRERRWHNANISVMLDDEFFELLELGGCETNEDGEDTFFCNPTIEPQFQERVIAAWKLFRAIAINAHATADPGILFFDNAKRRSPIREFIRCTNPCFAPGTMVATRQGHFPIETLVDKDVEVWDGGRWVHINNFRVTGENQPLLRVSLKNGQTMDVTPNHKFILKNGDRIQAKKLKKGMKLKSSNKRVHGKIKAKAAYLKGFLLGDGTYDANNCFPILRIHGDKIRCSPRLMASLGELEAKHTQGVNNRIYTHKDPELMEQRSGKQTFTVLTGLAGYKEDLNPWVTTYRDRLPAEIYNWDLDSVAEFVAGYMDADGNSLNTKNGYGYQLSSIHLECLKDFQLLLYSLGIKSKLKLMKKGGKKDFGKDRGGICNTQDCYRITIPQSASIEISGIVNFSRLISFSDRSVKLVGKDNGYQVESVVEAGTAEKVYCCTVPENHSFLLTNGVISAQCGEVYLPKDSACNLGSIVMPKFVSRDEETNFVKVDRRDLKRTVEYAVRFLDNVLTVSTFATEAQRISVQDKFRQLGLGIMGWSDFIRELEVPYASRLHLETIADYGDLIADASYRESEALAAHRGACGVWPEIKDIETGNPFDDKRRARRNSTVLSIAPTGSIAQLAGCSWAFEPDFALSMWKQVFVDASASEQKWVQMIHPSLERLDLSEEDRKIVLETGSVSGTQFAKDNPTLADCYQIAPEIPPQWHLEIQAAWQEWIDSSISKTVNLPKSTTVEDIQDIYLQANQLGMKGITIYIDGTLESEPIKIGSGKLEDDSNEEELEPVDLSSLPSGNEVENKTYENGCKDGVCSI